MFDVATHYYSVNIGWANHFLPYVCEHVHVDRSQRSADLLFQFRNGFWNQPTVILIFFIHFLLTFTLKSLCNSSPQRPWNNILQLLKDQNKPEFHY